MRQSSSNREVYGLRIGKRQALGVIFSLCGAIFASYYMGYAAGQELGFDRASVEALVQSSRLPILADDFDNEGAGATSENIYARLAQTSFDKGSDIVPPIIAFEERAGVPLREVRQGERQTSRSLGSLAQERLPSPAAADLGAESKSGADALNDGSNRMAVASGNPGASLGAMIGEKKGFVVAKKESSSQGQESLLIEAERGKRLLESEVVPSSVDQGVSTDSEQSTNALKVEVAPPPATPKGWYVQVAAPQKESDAKSMSEQLVASGFPSRIETIEIRGVKYYRVLVGPESSKLVADRMLAQVKREKYVTADPFLRFSK